MLISPLHAPSLPIFHFLAVAGERDRKIIGLRTFAFLQLQLDIILMKETGFTLIHLEEWRDNEKEDFKMGGDVGEFGF